jgi:bifunctional DNA-binding transcriptional regulator/antitoxin component of YhaV-PrlF toxin-antitoxin module
MNMYTIAIPNSKGQVVIPKKFRDELKMKKDQPLQVSVFLDGIYLKPIERIVTGFDDRKAYIEYMKTIQGSWANDEDDREERRQVELKAAKKIREEKW